MLLGKNGEERVQGNRKRTCDMDCVINCNYDDMGMDEIDCGREEGGELCVWNPFW